MKSTHRSWFKWICSLQFLYSMHESFYLMSRWRNLRPVKVLCLKMRSDKSLGSFIQQMFSMCPARLLMWGVWWGVDNEVFVLMEWIFQRRETRKEQVANKECADRKQALSRESKHGGVTESNLVTTLSGHVHRHTDWQGSQQELEASKLSPFLQS